MFSPLIFSIVIIAIGLCDYVHEYIISNGIMEGIPKPSYLYPPTSLFNYLFTYLNLPNLTLFRLGFHIAFIFLSPICLDLILVVIEWFRLCNRHKSFTFDLLVFKVQSFFSQDLCFFLPQLCSSANKRKDFEDKRKMDKQVCNQEGLRVFMRYVLFC